MYDVSCCEVFVVFDGLDILVGYVKVRKITKNSMEFIKFLTVKNYLNTIDKCLL